MSKETVIYEFEKDSEFYFEIMDLWKVSFELCYGWLFFLENKNTKDAVFHKQGKHYFGIKPLKDKFKLIYTRHQQDLAYL